MTAYMKFGRNLSDTNIRKCLNSSLNDLTPKSSKNEIFPVGDGSQIRPLPKAPNAKGIRRMKIKDEVKLDLHIKPSLSSCSSHSRLDMKLYTIDEMSEGSNKSNTSFFRRKEEEKKRCIEIFENNRKCSLNRPKSSHQSCKPAGTRLLFQSITKKKEEVEKKPSNSKVEVQRTSSVESLKSNKTLKSSQQSIKFDLKSKMPKSRSISKESLISSKSSNQSLKSKISQPDLIIFEPIEVKQALPNKAPSKPKLCSSKSYYEEPRPGSKRSNESYNHNRHDINFCEGPSNQPKPKKKAQFSIKPVTEIEEYRCDYKYSDESEIESLFKNNSKTNLCNNTQDFNAESKILSIVSSTDSLLSYKRKQIERLAVTSSYEYHKRMASRKKKKNLESLNDPFSFIRTNSSIGSDTSLKQTSCFGKLFCCWNFFSFGKKHKRHARR